MSKCLKIKKMLNLVISELENHITCKRAIKLKLQFRRNKKQYFHADTKLQFDQTKRKNSGKE